MDKPIKVSRKVNLRNDYDDYAADLMLDLGAVIDDAERTMRGWTYTFEDGRSIEVFENVFGNLTHVLHEVEK